VPISALIRLHLRMRRRPFVFEAPATTEIYTLSLHDALPISGGGAIDFGVFQQTELANDGGVEVVARDRAGLHGVEKRARVGGTRSEEHTSELQSRENLVCRLLLEKKKKNEQRRSHEPHEHAA